jgi:hypothetical protein
VTTADAGQARTVTHGLLIACSPGGDLAKAAVPASFRCWTPYQDWQHGEAGLAALQRVLAGFCRDGGDDDPFRPRAVITDGEVAVVEAVTIVRPGQPSLSMTLVLALSDGLVDEVRVYVDPRALRALL